MTPTPLPLPVAPTMIAWYAELSDMRLPNLVISKLSLPVMIPFASLLWPRITPSGLFEIKPSFFSSLVVAHRAVPDECMLRFLKSSTAFLIAWYIKTSWNVKKTTTTKRKAMTLKETMRKPDLAAIRNMKTTPENETEIRWKMNMFIASSSARIMNTSTRMRAAIFFTASSPLDSHRRSSLQLSCSVCPLLPSL